MGAAGPGFLPFRSFVPAPAQSSRLKELRKTGGAPQLQPIPPPFGNLSPSPSVLQGAREKRSPGAAKGERGSASARLSWQECQARGGGAGCAGKAGLGPKGGAERAGGSRAARSDGSPKGENPWLGTERKELVGAPGGCPLLESGSAGWWGRATTGPRKRMEPVTKWNPKQVVEWTKGKKIGLRLLLRAWIFLLRSCFLRTLPALFCFFPNFLC